MRIKYNHVIMVEANAQVNGALLQRDLSYICSDFRYKLIAEYLAVVGN